MNDKAVTLRLPPDLVEWLDQEAKANLRSRNQHIIWLLKQAKERGEKDE